MSKIEEFKKYAKNMIEDGYLDVGEEREAMIKAAELGLESKVAMKTLEELCISNGATLERVAQEQFRNRILDVIDDGFLDNGDGPSTKKYPSCDSFAPELKQANKSWHEAAEKSNYCTGNPTVYTLNKKIKDYCEPFMDLSRKSQRKAETQYPCWEYCERDQEQIDLIADKYIAWAKKRSGGIKSCEWIRRCLAVVENHAACTEAKKTYGCDISQAALTRCQ